MQTLRNGVALLAMLAAPLATSAAMEASSKAKYIATRSIIIDTHIDVPYRMHKKFEDVTQATESGEFDYPRAKAGGLNAPFMSVYVPASYENNGAYDFANKMIDIVEDIAERAPDKFAIATSVADVEKHFEQGLISLPMGMENGSPMEGKMENLEYFYDKGIRYITLAHSLANHISDSSYDIRRPNKGLSEFGKKLVKEMNDIGMMIDISHVSDEAFFQTLEISKVPVIASHSSLRHFVPGFERNMSDEMLLALKKNGGIININFGSSFVSMNANNWRNKFKDATKSVADRHGSDSPQAKAYSQMYMKMNPYPFASLDLVLDHIDYVVKLIGIEHVGIGSDYDGVGDSLPTDLKDVSTFPNLVQGLLDRGYSETDIKKILGENMLRVWKQVEVYAANN
jgi:membrane dipeptidase